jgi:hypothetical protein
MKRKEIENMTLLPEPYRIDHPNGTMNQGYQSSQQYHYESSHINQSSSDTPAHNIL